VSRHHHGYPRYGYGVYRSHGYGHHWDYWPRIGFSTIWAPSYGYPYYRGYGDGYPYYDTVGYHGGGSAATSGLLLGALAGGIIGHNSGEFRHNGWRGAAWGAGLGWLLGSVADAHRRPAAYPTAPVVMPQPQVMPAAQPAAPAPQQVTIINNYYNSGSPMSAANGLFGR
jgi:hypothetical protein